MKNELFRHQNSVEFIIPSKNLTFFVNRKSYQKSSFWKFFLRNETIFLLISESRTNSLHPMANSCWNGREWWTTEGHHFKANVSGRKNQTKGHHRHFARPKPNHEWPTLADGSVFLRRKVFLILKLKVEKWFWILGKNCFFFD